MNPVTSSWRNNGERQALRHYWNGYPQVGKMAVRCHASFFRAGKSTPSSLSLKFPPDKDSVEECREAFLKCLCLTALKVRAFVIRWNGGTRASIGN